jgi:predicted  nucleic acid-binding Zn-ribbon protein
MNVVIYAAGYVLLAVAAIIVIASQWSLIKRQHDYIEELEERLWTTEDAAAKLGQNENKLEHNLQIAKDTNLSLIRDLDEANAKLKSAHNQIAVLRLEYSRLRGAK